jgi:hypothetical protein
MEHPVLKVGDKTWAIWSSPYLGFQSMVNFIPRCPNSGFSMDIPRPNEPNARSSHSVHPCFLVESPSWSNPWWLLNSFGFLSSHLHSSNPVFHGQIQPPFFWKNIPRQLDVTRPLDRLDPETRFGVTLWARKASEANAWLRIPGFTRENSTGNHGVFP